MRSLVMTTIETRAVPPDTQGAEQQHAADVESAGALVASLAICALGSLIACTTALVLRRFPMLRLITRPLAEAQLRDIRRK